MKILAYLIALFVAFSPVLADEASPTPKANPTPNVRDLRGTVKEEVQQLRKNFKEGFKERKVELKDEDEDEDEDLEETTDSRIQAQNLREATKQELERRREEFKQAQEQLREEFKTRMEEARERAKQEFETRREELKNKLETVKNENKKRIVEKISEQLDELNARLMKHFSEVLDKLEKVLANIQSRTEKAEANGHDVAAIRTAIQAAEDAILAARAAIEAQAAKTYTPGITGDEEKLRVEVGRARQALHSDLAVLREVIRNAYKAVRNVATSLAQIPRVDDEVEVESEETQSPTPLTTESPVLTP